MRENLKVGDRIIGKGVVDGVDIRNKTGEVMEVSKTGWYSYCVRFDEPHPHFHKETSHTQPRLWWVHYYDIEPLEKCEKDVNEERKFYNGKFVVIDSRGYDYTPGRIYTVKNGQWRTDFGISVPISPDCYSFADVERICMAKIIEVVD